MSEIKESKDFIPQILVFSTDKISDPGIDLAGQQHVHYPPTVYTIIIPCSSGVKPKWILRAFKKGFDGVFIAADGTDCPYSPNCSEQTGKLVFYAQELMKKEKINPARLKMAAICSVCAIPFVNHMKNFSKSLIELGSIKSENYKNI
jgi:coenzyme F420-reducing hydrogenase delta subunit